MLQVFEKFVTEIDLFRSNVLGYGLVTAFLLMATWLFAMMFFFLLYTFEI